MCRIFISLCYISIFMCYISISSCYISVFMCRISVSSCYISVSMCRISVSMCRISISMCRISVFTCRATSLPIRDAEIPPLGGGGAYFFTIFGNTPVPCATHCQPLLLIALFITCIGVWLDNADCVVVKKSPKLLANGIRLVVVP